MFKLKSRYFNIKESKMNINKIGDKYYLFPEIYMESEKFDGTYWSPNIYVNNGIEIKLDELTNEEIVFDYDASIKDDECWTLYVFEHEDILKSQIKLKRIDENLYNIAWNGIANVNWNDEYDKNVPFECECNISISNYDKYFK
jgi:hypothetical protein